MPSYRSRYGNLVRVLARTESQVVLVVNPGSAEQSKHVVDTEQFEDMVARGDLVEKGGEHA